MTQNKGIGMTEGEWNQIAIRNAESFKQEAEAKKKKAQEQKDLIRQELIR